MTNRDQDLREGVWYRDGLLLYTLKPHISRIGRSKGFENRDTVRVDGPDAEAIVEQIHSALAAPPRPVDAERVDFDSQNPLHWAEKYRDEFIKRMTAEAEIRALRAPPAHSPDKAVTREGLKTRMEAALDGKTKWSRDCHLSGEYLCSLVWPMVEEALAPKPTGTEAGRGVTPAGWKLVPKEPTEEMQAAGSTA